MVSSAGSTLGSITTSHASAAFAEVVDGVEPGAGVDVGGDRLEGRMGLGPELREPRVAIALVEGRTVTDRDPEADLHP